MDICRTFIGKIKRIMESLFTPEYKVLNDLFGNDIKYVIPAYQRPYSWECVGKSDKNNQINAMWDDLVGHFDGGEPKPYFLGSMVLIGDSSKREFEVIDGQQRLTSLTLLFVAIKCFLNEVHNKGNFTPKNDANPADLTAFIKEAIGIIDYILFNRVIFGASLQEKKVRIEHSIGFNYDTVLKAVMECQQYSPALLSDARAEEAEVCRRYFSNHDFFVTKLEEKFLTPDSNNSQQRIFTFENAKNINNFVEFLKNRVAVVRIMTANFEVAYQVFEILNNRGLPLSNKDLFRNFLIRELYDDQTNSKRLAPHEARQLATEQWKHLDEQYTLDNEFISRYVESRNAQNQRYSAFNDLKSIYAGYQPNNPAKSKVVSFYEHIEAYLLAYTKIIDADFDNDLRGRVKFIHHAGNTTYSLNLLLSLFHNIEDDAQRLMFISEYERYLLYMLIGPSKRFSTSPIYGAIKKLNDKNFPEAIACIKLPDSEKLQLKPLLDGQIKDNAIAKLLVAKCFWIQDAKSMPDIGDFSLNYHDATLEHIMPQQPEQNTNWLRDFSADFRKEYTYKLGNMTLLTQKMNSSVKNYDFSRKKSDKGYKDTKFPFTVSLSLLDQVHEQVIRERHQSFMSILIEGFGL
jgi:hypothetical protein